MKPEPQKSQVLVACYSFVYNYNICLIIYNLQYIFDTFDFLTPPYCLEIHNQKTEWMYTSRPVVDRCASGVLTSSISRSAKHKDALLCNKEAFAFDFSRLLLVLEDWDINHFATVLC